MSDKLNNEHHEDSESSKNLYSNQYEQEQLAGLEENAPQLNTPIDRTVNKKAIAFIIAAGFGLAGLGAFAYHQFSDSEEAPPQSRPEVVTVPDLPDPEPQVMETPPVSLLDEKQPDPETPTTTEISESKMVPIEIPSSPSVETPPSMTSNIPVESVMPAGNM